MKTRLEISLPDGMDPFPALDKLMLAGSVYRANLIDYKNIVIFYDNRRLNEPEILKAIGLKSSIKQSEGAELKRIINEHYL